MSCFFKDNHKNACRHNVVVDFTDANVEDALRLGSICIKFT